MSDIVRARDAEERGEGICRTCCEPIWNEGGTVGHRKVDEGWSDRVERGGDSLVCFKAAGYRHVPLDGREAAIYDRAFTRGAAQSLWNAAQKVRQRQTAPNADIGPNGRAYERRAIATMLVGLSREVDQS